MRIVERAELAPAQCAFTKSMNGPFVDLLRDFDFDHQGRVYIRVEFVKDLGRLVGMVDVAELDAVLGQVERLEGQVAELEGELEESRRFRDALDVIESEGFRARRKPGRPRKEPVDA